MRIPYKPSENMQMVALECGGFAAGSKCGSLINPAKTCKWWHWNVAGLPLIPSKTSEDMQMVALEKWDPV
jgi:hypothetical protein